MEELSYKEFYDLLREKRPSVKDNTIEYLYESYKNGDNYANLLILSLLEMI